jgi:hypothetical protein
VKVVAGEASVEQVIASLNVALSTWLTSTPVAVFAGIVEITAGGGVIVVNVHTVAATSGVPANDVAPVVIVAV